MNKETNGDAEENVALLRITTLERDGHKVVEQKEGCLTVPQYEKYDNLIISDYEVFDNLLEWEHPRYSHVLNFYRQILRSVESNATTVVWFIGEPGGGKSTAARQFVWKVDHDRDLSKKLGEIGLPLTIRHLTFDECVFYAKQQRGVGWEEKSSDEDHAVASYIMSTSILRMREHFKPPLLLTVETPFFPYPLRDLGGTAMEGVIGSSNTWAGESHFVVAVVPNEGVRSKARNIRTIVQEKILEASKVKPTERLTLLRQSMATAETGDRLREMAFRRIDQLIEGKKLPLYLTGFRGDPNRITTAYREFYKLQCRCFFDRERWRFMVVENRLLPEDVTVHSYDEVFNLKPHKYSLPLGEMSEEAFRVLAQALRLTPKPHLLTILPGGLVLDHVTETADGVKKPFLKP